MANKTIPYKIYLEEHEMPRQWYNVRADMKKKPSPLLNPGTLQPVTEEELAQVFCHELVKQELDEDIVSLYCMLVLCFLSALVAVLLPSFYRLFTVFSSRLTRREQHEKKRLPNLQKG